MSQPGKPTVFIPVCIVCRKSIPSSQLTWRTVRAWNPLIGHFTDMRKPTHKDCFPGRTGSRG